MRWKDGGKNRRMKEYNLFEWGMKYSLVNVISCKFKKILCTCKNKVWTYSRKSCPLLNFPMTLFLVYLRYYNFYRPQTKLRKGNVFTPVCDSVHRGWSLCLGGSLSRGVSDCRGVSLTAGGLCQGDTSHTVKSGRYASCWNAFLFDWCRQFLDRKYTFDGEDKLQLKP